MCFTPTAVCSTADRSSRERLIAATPGALRYPIYDAGRTEVRANACLSVRGPPTGVAPRGWTDVKSLYR